jgi:long-chain acyl-CoA synthetase
MSNKTFAETSDSYCTTLPETLNDPSLEWIIRRSRLTAGKPLVELFPGDHDTRTLYDVFERSVALYGSSPYLGHRGDYRGGAGFEFLTYAQCSEQRNALGSGLVHLLGGQGLGQGHSNSHSQNQRVGIYSHNSVGWMLCDLALHAYGMTCVPLYDTLGPDAVEYIANHAELAAICCSVHTLDKLLPVLSSCSVRVVVVYDTAPQQRVLGAENTGDTGYVVRTIDRVQAIGVKNPLPHRPPSPGDVALINYTSGTTGTPKGAVLTHRALIANAAGSSMVVADVLDAMGGQIRHISYLPLAHIYERFNVTLITYRGGAIGFYRGDVLTLLEDVEALKPTTFASVPRLYNRIFDKVMAQIEAANPVARRLFWTAYNYKKANILRGDLTGGAMAPVLDRLVFSKIRAKLGGQVRMMSSGASPISPDVFLFLRIVFGGDVLEGYGMTETACLITLTVPGDPTFGHVGAPIPSCEVKLQDIPEMNYSNADKPYPRGEICVRGPILFSGYLKNEEATRETIDEHGWLHTGDVGMWLPGGRLKIFDRKKSIFKLAQGEYISPEKIEGVYQRSPFVLQAFVYGDSLQAQLVAVVVPDPEYVLPWAGERRLSQDMNQLIASPVLLTSVMKSMREEARSAGLKGFEQAAAIRLHPVPMSVENGLMTPTFKIKRDMARKEFQHLIDQMYETLL